jgi:divalent metal cation (Fe/Co/Zn/Cd) transporter
MIVLAAMTSDEAKFKRYLLDELFWELAQHRPSPAELEGVPQEAIEVLTFKGYHDVRIRVAGKAYDVHLTWRKDTPPSIRLAD